jgi:polar amino acid transport system permease protein
MRGREIISETFLAFEIWFTIAAIYLVVTVSLSILVSLMERRLGETG